MSANKHVWRLKRRDTANTDDIRYLGPLSYRAFEILGWLCVVLAVAIVVVLAGTFIILYRSMIHPLRRFVALMDVSADHASEFLFHDNGCVLALILINSKSFPKLFNILRICNNKKAKAAPQGAAFA